jgi:membrane protein involved in colicin uptake
MPARKRHRRRPEHPDPVVRFGRALDQARSAEEAERKRIQAEREAAEHAAKLAAEHAARLAAAKRRLEHAITAVKSSRSSGVGTAEADAAYRAAKARVVELETGERPSWAPATE